MSDPRFKNFIFEGSLGEILSSYASAIKQALDAVDPQQLERAAQTILKTVEDRKTIYACGNGGSSAIGEHLCCDFTKGTFHPSHAALKTQNLTSNAALLTALSNDFSFDVALSKQLGYFCEKGDVLLAISSSGNSENIIRAVSLAQERGATVIGLSGFSGGRLKALADISLHIPFENYGVVEDCHQALTHILAQYIARLRDREEIHAL